MKNRTLIILFIWISCTLQGYISARSQPPPKQWALKFGGSNVDIPLVIKPTTDGGSIAGGYTTSKNGDVSPYPVRDYWDLWVIKLDACGNIMWQKSFGGRGYESARDVVQTSDGGYLILGETNSTDGGVIAGFGGTKDIWLLKLNASGNLAWQKRLGGNGLDIGNKMVQLDDGNFLIAATTSSADGDIKGNHGSGGFTDGALLKIDPLGNVLWSKCYGGTNNEELLDIQIINGKTYVAGYANSTDGDIPSNQKNYDVWLLTVDQAGNKISSKIYGGSQNDVAYAMTKGNDGTLTLAGYTTSADGDVTESKGSQDYWILNVSTDGKLNWQRTLGGTDAEYATSIITDGDGGYITGGISYSNDGDIAGAKGMGDYWVVKLTAKGALSWKQNYGGSGNDYLRSIFYRPASKEYYLAGDSEAGGGDFKNDKGETDFGIIKLKITDTLTLDSIVCNVANFNAPAVMLKDNCSYDSVLVTYKPVKLKSPLDQLAKADTIFQGQTVAMPMGAQGFISWGSDPTLSCTHCTNPVASPTRTTTYIATIDINGCSVSDNYKIVVLEDALVRLPNAFTPNGDGVNDFFGPAGKVPAEYKMQIFNRNGEIVFKSSSINNRWDGRFKGMVQSSGAFVYMIQYKNILNQSEIKKGTLLLIR
ncbi:MAG: gliding motility-associated C-terminal domain-containing protein [Flavitalea sp.]